MKILLRDKEYEITKNKDGKYSIPKEIKELLQISVSCINIDGNRVGTETMNKTTSNGNTKSSNLSMSGGNYEREVIGQVDGRYPAQTFIDSQVAELLDKQSGINNSGGSGKIGTYRKAESPLEFTSPRTVSEKNYIPPNIGGCSKILHKCDYTQEDYDLYYYEPKVSSSERNAGCDGFEDDYSSRTFGDGIGDVPNKNGLRPNAMKNNHPTLKPIDLNYRILSLFKTPNDQVICYAFAGAGSEIIGGIKAGFENWHGCEINQEYVDIANARIKYWREEMTTQVSLFDL